jgi:hypothetical protein
MWCIVTQQHSEHQTWHARCGCASARRPFTGAMCSRPSPLHAYGPACPEDTAWQLHAAALSSCWPPNPLTHPKSDVIDGPVDHILVQHHGLKHGLCVRGGITWRQQGYHSMTWGYVTDANCWLGWITAAGACLQGRQQLVCHGVHARGQHSPAARSLRSPRRGVLPRRCGGGSMGRRVMSCRRISGRQACSAAPHRGTAQHGTARHSTAHRGMAQHRPHIWQLPRRQPGAAHACTWHLCHGKGR